MWRISECFRSAEEIMTMLLEASEEGMESNWDGGHIVWFVRYALEGEQDNSSLANANQMGQQNHHHHHMEKRKLQTRLEIQKDDIQAVLPISKVSAGNAFPGKFAHAEVNFIPQIWFRRFTLRAFCLEMSSWVYLMEFCAQNIVSRRYFELDKENIFCRFQNAFVTIVFKLQIKITFIFILHKIRIFTESKSSFFTF